MASTPSSSTTNLDKLHNAGVLEKSNVKPVHSKIINEQLSESEVNALISAKKKLGLKNFESEDGGGF
jgi:hypothetical protein